jgi:hypothetical protein
MPQTDRLLGLLRLIGVDLLPSVGGHPGSGMTSLPTFRTR